MLKYSMVVIAKEITHYCGIALFRERRCKRKITLKYARFWKHAVQRKVRRLRTKFNSRTVKKIRVANFWALELNLKLYGFESLFVIKSL